MHANMKKGFILGIVTLMCWFMMMAIQADEKPGDVLKTSTQGIVNLGQGSAAIQLKSEHSILNKRFAIYQLFNVENAKGLESVNYTFVKEYKGSLQQIVGSRLDKEASSVTEYEVIDYIQSLNENKVKGADAELTEADRYSDFRYFVEALRDRFNENKVAYQTIEITHAIDDKSVFIEGLSDGYYLIDEITAVKNSHDAASLCMVDTANPIATIELKADYPSIEKKIYEDDNDIGWNDIGDYAIGQTIPYRYTTYVPNLDGYHTYFFSFHDKMDPALKLVSDSIQIKINDYTLDKSEFLLVQPSLDDTFRVEIKDLKEIVDREFGSTYGQRIELSYDAYLGDQAYERLGRPGFENAVRLEFSNDPDSSAKPSTGYTPWDSVVCFTFGLDITKINEDQKTLEGASFKLYEDKDCTDEIFVKKSEAGYVVMDDDRVNEILKETMVSNDSGHVTIYGLDQGTYYLKEMEAPTGYRKILDPIEITIKPTYTEKRNDYVGNTSSTDAVLQSLNASATISTFVLLESNVEAVQLVVDQQAGMTSLDVVNAIGMKLPFTGNIWILGFSGLIIGLCIILVIHERKKRL